MGSNSHDERFRIIDAFAMDMHPDRIEQLLKEMYHGGYGIETAHGKISAWYAEDGIHLAHGKSAQHIRTAHIVPWSDAVQRIGELLERGEFATQIEVAAASQQYRRYLATRLDFILGDMNESAREQGFLPTLRAFPHIPHDESLANIIAALADPAQLPKIAVECQEFKDAFLADRNLMRFRYRYLPSVMDSVTELLMPRRTYDSDWLEMPKVEHFITEDEINAVLNYGEHYEG